ncbi:ATP-binding protein [Glycomyces paridis]|uniref:ATP-binding protein n=1 Tax=Glycomyces paridis TaxID=2126555 RepID=A0A4S8PKJ2_9ACTN|nr:ATP-binding protein [Glycomyces paridis]THV30215.1 ATP-binding protein [Glycomyces paridis]
MRKPEGMFDRDFEWGELVRFAENRSDRATLGVVSGRRRQGKTFLLDALTRASGGFMFTATETTEADALSQFGASLARYLGEPVPLRFTSWDEAISRLLRLPTDRPVMAVIDEFPFLAQASPSLPSVIQRALDPGSQHSNSPVRLLLCGSAVTFMGRLLSGTAPLRGRAGLELIVPTLDYRLARAFWGIEDERTAVQVNAVVGGTPAYRREFAQDDAPEGPDDFDDWVVRTVLNPARPLFREGRYLLAEEPGVRDTGPLHAVLAAIATGSTARGAIATRIGKKATDLAHPLAVLEDAGLVRHEPDAFKRNRSFYRIAEPIIAYYHAVMRPVWGELERPGRAGQVWRRMQGTFRSQVLGPHFESLAREWARLHASAEELGGLPNRVAAGIVSDPKAGTTHEIDVVVHGTAADGSDALLAIGEVKWNEEMDCGHLRRLTRLRDLLVSQGRASEGSRLICFGGAGFSDELRRIADTDPMVELVDPARLYV